MGLYPTAASAMVADLSPPQRRGEILGFYGAAGSVALAVGPVTGIAIVERAGFGALFWIAGAVAALSVAVTLAAGETLARRRTVPFTVKGSVSGAALFPGLLALCLTFSYGGQVAFLPLHADSMGVNPGVFFLVFAVTITIARGPAGRLSDRIGRPPVAAAGLLCAAAAMTVLAFSDGGWGLAAAGAVYGLAWGIAQPALIAWSVDAVPEGERGRAMGTYHTAFELGIVIGAASAGLAVARWGFAGTFLATAGVAAAGAALALAGRPRDGHLPHGVRAGDRHRRRVGGAGGGAVGLRRDVPGHRRRGGGRRRAGAGRPAARLVTWGAPIWPPNPPNARHAPAKPWRSSVSRQSPSRRRGR
jgi:MFS family permease